jgi:hypothetical protein
LLILVELLIITVLTFFYYVDIGRIVDHHCFNFLFILMHSRSIKIVLDLTCYKQKCTKQNLAMNRSRCECKNTFFLIGRRGRMVVGFTTTCEISTHHPKIVSSNLVHGEVYSIQHYVIKFVSDLRQVSGFLRFPPPINLTATILLKYC